MATETKKTKNNPTTISDEMSLEIFSWAPKRVLWDALYGIVPGDSHEDRMRSIIALCNDGGSLFSKKVLAHFSFVKTPKEEEGGLSPEMIEAHNITNDGTKERFTDDIPTTVVEEAPVARAASVEGPPKKKAASKKKAAAKKSKKSKK